LFQKGKEFPENFVFSWNFLPFFALPFLVTAQPAANF